MQERKRIFLTENQIEELTRNRCSASNWRQVLVTEGFDPSRVMDVTFEGDVRIGRLDGEVEVFAGERRKAGLCRARLHNVDIGDNCFISSVAGRLSNVNVGTGVVIENVGTIACVGESSFGNGREIAVLNEGGGRELKITGRTSAQIAYLTVLHRENKALTNALNAMADRYSNEMKNNRASIGEGARIANCNSIVNVSIGPRVFIDGALFLENGTIDSSAEAPSSVGSGVIAEDFIFQKGSSVHDGAMVVSSLVGEAVRVGKQFSAENSVFFANSECFHSEACSVFGGPYTVTHHRSTLLIAALCSFYNAGSGTNQSNHMYKLGPVHQGILERGCKTGSFSYLLWPSRIGAFTAVMGKHYANFDTSEFPFSYIDDENGTSMLVPGMNLLTVGTTRDCEKWPKRDRRKSREKLDLIVFEALSPYTAGKMLNARDILARLYNESKRDQEYVVWKGIHIKRLLLRTCSRYYKLGLDKYLGDALIRKIGETSPSDTMEALKRAGAEAAPAGEWSDMCGLICSKDRMDSLISDICAGRIDDFDALHDSLRRIHGAYRDDEWKWIAANYHGFRGKATAEETPGGLAEAMDAWKDASIKLFNMVLNDARKEFEGNVRIGFGIDGESDADFTAVRGSFDENAFVVKLRNEMEEVNRKHAAIVGLLRK